MKYFIVKVGLVIGLIFAFNTAHAGPFMGWQTIVTASNGTSSQSISVSEPTYPMCQAARQNAINQLISTGYVFGLTAPNCTPIPFEIPRLIDWREKIRWPWPGPVCLSCPLFNNDFVELVYPEHIDRVRGLMKEYEVEAYNKELLQLQERYNLEAFEKEMFDIELEQNFHQQKR